MAATVVDALIVTLGLDPKNFNQGQKQAVNQLIQFRNQTRATAKQTEEALGRTVQFFRALRTEAVGVFSILLGAAGIEELTRKIVVNASSIDKLSNRYQVSVGFISAFGNAIKKVGGTVEEAQGFIAQLANSLALADINLPDDLFIKLQNLAGLVPGGGSLLGRKGGKFDVEQTVKNIAALIATSTPANRNLIANMLGTPPGVFEAFRKGNLSQQLAAQADQTAIDKELADASQKLVEAFNDLQNRVLLVAAKMLDPLLPALTQIADLLNAMTRITGKQLLKDWFGLTLPEPPENPPVLFDLPGFLKGLFGGKAEAKPTTEDDNYRKGIEMLKGKMKPTSSLGNTPIGVAALAATLKDVPGFRTTSTTGGTHVGTAHAEGRAIDFVVDPAYYDAVIKKLREEGVKVIDARTPDSAAWTGPHIHAEFASKAAAARFQATGSVRGGDTNSAETHIGTINVHAPSTDADDIVKSIDTHIKRSSMPMPADAGFE